MYHFDDGDRVYIFGFSRGAYTARVVAALVRGVGILRRECENLIPYALRYLESPRGEVNWGRLDETRARAEPVDHSRQQPVDVPPGPRPTLHREAERLVQNEDPVILVEDHLLDQRPVREDHVGRDRLRLGQRPALGLERREKRRVLLADQHPNLRAARRLGDGVAPQRDLGLAAQLGMARLSFVARQSSAASDP